MNGTRSVPGTGMAATTNTKNGVPGTVDCSTGTPTMHIDEYCTYVHRIRIPVASTLPVVPGRILRVNALRVFRNSVCMLVPQHISEDA